MKPTLHLIGIFHTIHNKDYSHCAFTGKALRFSKMMKQYGYEVIEYANEGSESEADEKVVMLTKDRLTELTGKKDEKAFHGDLAAIGTPHHREFEAKLITEIQKRIKPKDIVCHPFGHAHQAVKNSLPGHTHVETGIGYPTLMPGTIRIFESYAWRHFHAGKDKNNQGKHFEFVIPNYFEINDWVPKYEPGSYYAFLGRIDSCKGLDTILEIARKLPEDGPKIILHGQGDHTKWLHPNIEYRGPLKGDARSEFMRNAICSLMPTNFIEPFGGSGVEGLLCGTPLIGTDYGAFTETIKHGVNGFRCHTLGDWMQALKDAPSLDRKKIADEARATYSLEACGKMYDKAFEIIYSLYGSGWYTIGPAYGQSTQPNT
jgi:glycosyltransferase involved in cell wall biosynthesis